MKPATPCKITSKCLFFTLLQIVLFEKMLSHSITIFAKFKKMKTINNYFTGKNYLTESFIDKFRLKTSVTDPVKKFSDPDPQIQFKKSESG